MYFYKFIGCRLKLNYFVAVCLPSYDFFNYTSHLQNIDSNMFIFGGYIFLSKFRLNKCEDMNIKLP